MGHPKTLRILIVAAMPALLAATPVGDRGPVDEIAKIEIDFAAAFQEKTWQSFVERAADDAVFPNTPYGFVPGQQFFVEGGTSRRAMLDWWPSHVEVACGNDLAWSTGPVVRKDPRGVWYSHYITVWARQPDGVWRWVFDRGIAHVDKGTFPRGTPPETVSRAHCPQVKPVPVEESRASLLAADRELLETARRDPRAAYGSRLADVSRLHRFGRSPIIGKQAALSAMAIEHPVVSFTPVGNRVSSTGDLGYTYGHLTWREKERREQSGLYLHIWRWNGSRWELVFDQINPHVPPFDLAPA